MKPNPTPDLLRGFAAIGAYLGITAAAARRRAENDDLPTFYRPGCSRVYARRSEIDKFMKRRVTPQKGRPPLPPDILAAGKLARDARRAERDIERREIDTLRKDAARAQCAAAGLLYGVEAIADHLSLTRRQVYHLHEAGELPTFKMGRTVCANTSALAKHFAECLRTARAPDVLRGHREIGEYLGLSSREIARLDEIRRLPTSRDKTGSIVATPSALDDWRRMGEPGR